MNLSYRWLRALAPDLDATPEQVADRLAMLGAPVDEVVPLGAGLGDIVVGRVLATRPHPNADRLTLCDVDAGTGETFQVVCGAPNVVADALFPLAPVGATLPDGMKIRKAKIRGEESRGMLCSERELGLGRGHEGIMRLPDGLEPGTPLLDALALDDVRLVVDVTPNRGDLLSQLGLARELAPHGVRSLRLPAIPGGGEPDLEVAAGDRESGVAGRRVRLEDEGGWRYMAAVIRGVRVAPSPAWLAARLRAIGARPINNVVDATNWVLFELGQPLHAFDLDRLRGAVVAVRAAHPGERLRTLDGVERELPDDALVIADGEGAVAVAGVMGGEESEVSPETRDILLECALFDPKRVRATRRALGLSTDASYRFERGVDPDGMEAALRRAVEIIVATAGGSAEHQVADARGAALEPRRLRLRPSRATSVLGLELTPERIADLLAPLGFQPEVQEGDVVVRVPGYRRHDVEREIDLVEEVARRIGYDHIPEQARPARVGAMADHPLSRVEDRLRDRLTALGLLEARSVPFVPASDGSVELLLPLSAEESRLRGALLPGLVRRVRHNQARGRGDVRLFELGTAFCTAGGGELPGEAARVAAVLTGPARPPHWTGAVPDHDVWDLKGLMESLAAEIGGRGWTVEPAVEPLDPRLAGDLLVARDRDGRTIGWGGRVDPQVVDSPAWATAPVWACEFALRPAADEARVAFVPPPSQPAVERDLALLLPGGVSARQVLDVVGRAAGDLLERVWPFDLYTGAGVPEGRRSVAFRLTFRAADRTLRDEEVDAIVDRVLTALREELDVERR